MINNARFYSFYKSSIIGIVRFFIPIISIYIALIGDVNNISVMPIFFLSWFLMFEIFFYYKICRQKPIIQVMQNIDDNYIDSFTLDALTVCGKSSDIFNPKKLFKDKAIKFIFHKSSIIAIEVPIIKITEEKIGEYAFILARQMRVKYVTTVDLFAAYILLIEEESKFLFSKNLKQNEFLDIILWTHFDYPDEENSPSSKVNFLGEGIGEFFISGWTLETNKYITDVTARVLRERPTVVGRNIEYQKVAEGLSKKEKNSILLVGNPGGGKTAIVEMLAFESNAGLLSKELNHKRFFELMIGPLLAGVNNQGELETRLQAIFQELLHAGNIILYIPNIQNILGASTFHSDLSGALLPHLRSGDIRVIATLTDGNYKLFGENRSDILDVFEVVRLLEPQLGQAIQMVLEKANIIERKYKVYITYKAVVESVKLAHRYMQENVLPGGAIRLITDSANSVAFANKKIVTVEDVINKIEEKTHIAVGVATGEEKTILLNLEKELHKRIIGQDEAVNGIAEAMRRLRSGVSASNKPISFLFLGPTGVGKTETAKALADTYFGGEEKIIRLDMSEYVDEAGIKRLLGSTPGEGEERGELTDKIHDAPFSLVLLDEFEKASPRILDLFLQVLEDGRLTDNKGKTVSFLNAIIIATSNAGSEFIREEISKGKIVDKLFQKNLADYLQTKSVFKPELLNRFDGVVTFKPLGVEEITIVTELILDKIIKRLAEQDIDVFFNKDVVVKIVTEGADREFGARPIRRYIQDNIEDILSKNLLESKIGRGSKIVFSVDNNTFITSIN
ncbi:hypothetical protein LBMAG33_6340 [Candidatus Levyibacteriota bacterium]|nr:ATP-dependent Clp protease ATP-binding subunit [Candidatus Levybacteria bacterium]GDX62324.1 hypothetical protein LBMAG33_6340 [Candidatus Levybacteria bacterium]